MTTDLLYSDDMQDIMANPVSLPGISMKGHRCMTKAE